MKIILKKIFIKLDIWKQVVYMYKKLMFNFTSDKNHFERLYYRKFSRKLDLNNPKTLNEKVIRRILYDREPIYTNLTDKYGVRNYVKNKIGEKYLIKLYGVYNTVDEIDFTKLPDNFVLKCTHDCGSVFICDTKKNFNIEDVKKKLKFYLKRNYYYLNREWHYKNIKPRIICEEKLADTTDYKLHCFNGKVMHIEVIKNRFSDMRINEYDREWNMRNFEVSGCKNTDIKIEKPINFELMIELAEKLSDELSYVRVDFYNIKGNIKFGEMTFTPAGGMDQLPHELDLELGQLWK